VQEKKEGKQEEMPGYIHESGEQMLKVLDSVMLVAQLDSDDKSQEKVMDVLPLVEKSLKHEVQTKDGGSVPLDEVIPRAPRSKAADGRYRLLLVEDNNVNAELVKAYLSDKYDLDIASDAKSAIRMTGEGLYDAILMDINLGPGMDGIQATKEIRNIAGYADIPVIAVTGFTMAGMKEKIMNGGASYFLAKPFGKNMLVDLLVTVLPENRDGKAG